MPTIKSKTKSQPKKKPVNIEDRLFTLAYIANYIGREYPNFPTLTAAEVAEELSNKFLKKWDREHDTYVDDLEEYLQWSAKDRIEEVESIYNGKPSARFSIKPCTPTH